MRRVTGYLLTNTPAEPDWQSDARTMKANVSNASVFAAPGDDKDQQSRVLVRKVDVEKVKVLAATCADTAR